MKGVIHANADAQIVDITHDLPRQDVRTGAFWLREILPWYPPAVHCAVIDPGVGTDRDAIAIQAGEHVLVGPDNGLLLPVARELAGVNEPESVEDSQTLTESSLIAYSIQIDDPESTTFHGRDVFAPAAATIHEATVDNLGDLELLTPTESVVDLTFPKPTVQETKATGDVMVVDDFGNTITNIPGSWIEGVSALRVNGEQVPVADTYAGVATGVRLVTVGSHGNVELAVNQGRGDEAFGLEPGDGVHLER